MPGPLVRRVVTGHNPEGLATIQTDDVAQGDRFTLIWTTEGFPVDNTGAADGGKRDVGITLTGGTVFRIGEIAPGARSPMHRTNSVDYGIVLDGELDMEVDGGESVHLRAGDVVVQRGTNHAWINKGSRPAKMAWILIDADPVRVGDRILEPTM
ncbi:MAG TPA: cupin domain-containing protein [Dehalococcoidia bacterium]|jgi:quercetin dioxygenase-like cupin family protein|nr:cupin domain-containing protein [Dehalococcoidia bacterium]